MVATNKIYFNRGTGGPNTKSRPICSETHVPTTALPTESGETHVPTTKEPIKLAVDFGQENSNECMAYLTADECEAYATADPTLRWERVDTWPDHPKGCFKVVATNKIYYNLGSGAPNTKSRPICSETHMPTTALPTQTGKTHMPTTVLPTTDQPTTSSPTGTCSFTIF